MEPTTLALVFVAATTTFNLPDNLLSSVCFVESSHKISAINKDDGNSPSLGICQIKLATARLLGFKGDSNRLMNPKINAYYAAKYLKKQLDRYKGDIIKAISSYNMGSYKQNSSGLPVNQQYVNKVFKAWVENR